MEAVCHLRPIVVWPSGVESVGAEVRALCRVATDWYSFARHVIDLCNKEDGAEALISKRNEILQVFSSLPDTVYRGLGTAFSALPPRSEQSPPTATGGPSDNPLKYVGEDLLN